jgi:hypothetical protein
MKLPMSNLLRIPVSRTIVWKIETDEACTAWRSVFLRPELATVKTIEYFKTG